MDDYPIKLGRILFTMVDPNPGYEVAYNRWYERDHFYGGCMIGPYLFAGRRWVAPKWLKELRFPQDSPVARPTTAGSYLSIYWRLLGYHEEASAWSHPQVFWLYKNGRGFDQRTHAHTSNYDFASVVYSDPDDGVPIELALDHVYKGLGVVVVEPADPNGRREDLLAWVEKNAAPALVKTDGVDNIASFVVLPELRNPSVERPAAPMDLGADGGSVERLVQLSFLEKDPTEVWDAFRDYAARIDAGGVGRVTFAAPFIPTVVGTDRYTDQLW